MLRIRKNIPLILALLGSTALGGCVVGIGERDGYAQFVAAEARLDEGDVTAVSSLEQIARTSRDRGIRQDALETLADHYEDDQPVKAATLYLQAIDEGSQNAILKLARLRVEQGQPVNMTSELLLLAKERPERGIEIAFLLGGEIGETRATDLRNAALFDLERRILNGEVSAARMLADAYVDGELTSGNPSTDIQRAENLYRQAAAAGDQSAVLKLARLLASKGDATGAEEVLLAAESKGYPTAGRDLARFYEDQSETDIRLAAEAAERYEALAQREGRDDYLLRAANLFSDADAGQNGPYLERARALWTRVGTTGNADAYYYLADSYDEDDLTQNEPRRDALGRAADMGHVRAARDLGRELYREGTDLVRAERLLTFASVEGETSATYTLGQLNDAAGTAEAYGRARRYFETAYADGYDGAALYLARYNALGRGGEISSSDAVRYLQDLDPEDAAKEAVRFGEAFVEGDGVRADMATALRWFETSWRFQPGVYNDRILRRLYDDKTTVSAAIRNDWRQRHAAIGVDTSLFDRREARWNRPALAGRSENSAETQGGKRVTPRGPTLTLDQYMSQLLDGDPETLVARAEVQRGELVEIGNANALYMIGRRLVATGDEATRSEGVAYMRSAANMRHPDASFWMADAYQTGVFGDVISAADARKFLEIAAAEGVVGAQYILGANYVSGENGFKRDPAEARTWLEKAKAGGDLRAGQLLEALLQ